MNKSVEDSIDFIKELDQSFLPKETVEVIVFPPFTSLFPVKGISSAIKIGSQNIHYETDGAYTGEISPIMLKNIAEYVLIGHSERRHIFGETDEGVNKKIITALKFQFKPVVCIGETLDERESGLTLKKIEEQIDKGLNNIPECDLLKLIIAYEPVWAIGTGLNATPQQAQEVHGFIREILENKTSTPGDIPILYGGSVKAENSGLFLSQTDIDGVLVGGASLKIDSFSGIIATA